MSTSAGSSRARVRNATVQTIDMAKTLHFKSKAGYNRWLAYGHMHVRGFGRGRKNIVIRGKRHRVKHRGR